MFASTILQVGIGLMNVLLLAASSTTIQKPTAGLTQVPAAQLTSEAVRQDPAASVTGLERVPSLVHSPDKRRTAHVRELSTGTESVRSQITIVGPGRRRITIATVVNYFGLTWSPDAGKIAFSEGAVVTIVDSDGKTRQVIHTGPGGRYPGACFDLQWSNDGRTLSFTQVENARQLDLSRPVRVSIALGIRPPGP